MKIYEKEWSKKQTKTTVETHVPFALVSTVAFYQKFPYKNRGKIKKIQQIQFLFRILLKGSFK